MPTGVTDQLSPAETEREAALRDFEAEVGDDPEATAATVRRAFVARFRDMGRGKPEDSFAPLPVTPRRGLPSEQPTETVVDVHPARGGVRITANVRTAPELERVLRAVGVSLPEEHVLGLRAMLKQPDRQRQRFRDPATVARVLTLHYLTVAGGGRLTKEQAADRYENAWGRPLPGGWEKEQWAVLQDLERDYGPV